LNPKNPAIVTNVYKNRRVNPMYVISILYYYYKKKIRRGQIVAKSPEPPEQPEQPEQPKEDSWTLIEWATFGAICPSSD
jgi:hypothetical protein